MDGSGDLQDRRTWVTWTFATDPLRVHRATVPGPFVAGTLRPHNPTVLEDIAPEGIKDRREVGR